MSLLDKIKEKGRPQLRTNSWIFVDDKNEFWQGLKIYVKEGWEIAWGDLSWFKYCTLNYVYRIKEFYHGIKTFFDYLDPNKPSRL
jgi:hypothetical protein